MDPDEAAHDEPSQLDLLFANSATVKPAYCGHLY